MSEIQLSKIVEEQINNFKLKFLNPSKEKKQEVKLKLLELHKKINIIKRKIYINAIKNDFKLYCRFMFPDSMRWDWFHDVVADKVIHMLEDRYGKLIYQTQNQAGKTLQLALALISYYFLRFPHKSSTYATYNNDRAKQVTNAIRAVIDSPKFKMLSPYFRIKTDHNFNNASEEARAYANSNSFNNAAILGSTGKFLAAGVGTALTGSPGHLSLVDDYFKDMHDAMSPVIREKIWQWWVTVVNTRQQTLDEGVIQIVWCTRWHSDDLIGRLWAEHLNILKQNHKQYRGWQKITIPALKEEKHMDTEYDPRNVGEYLMPDYNCDDELIELEQLEKNAEQYPLNYIIPVSNNINPSFTVNNLKFDFYRITYVINNMKKRYCEKLKINPNAPARLLQPKNLTKLIKVEGRRVFVSYTDIHLICQVKGGKTAFYITTQQNPAVWQAMCQQEPIDEMYQVFRKEMFNFYTMDTLPKRFSRIFISVDPNAKKTSDGSECGITVWGQYNRCLYILDILHGRWGFLQNEHKIVTLAEKYKGSQVIIGIETTGQGVPLIETLRSKYGYFIVEIVPSGGKIQRAVKSTRVMNIDKDIVAKINSAVYHIDIMQSAKEETVETMATFSLFVPDQSTHPESNYLINQLLTFTGLDNALNDLVDSVSQALTWFKNNDYVVSVGVKSVPVKDMYYSKMYNSERVSSWQEKLRKR
jgi:phage terminase large subunit-like protein